MFPFLKMQSYGRQNKSNYFNRTRNSDKKDRWDHDGYDKLATDQYYSSKYEKNWSKSKPDSAYYTIEKYVVKKQTQPEKADKWQHVPYLFSALSKVTLISRISSKRLKPTQSKATSTEARSLISNYTSRRRLEAREVRFSVKACCQITQSVKNRKRMLKRRK